MYISELNKFVKIMFNDIIYLVVNLKLYDNEVKVLLNMDIPRIS